MRGAVEVGSFILMRSERLKEMTPVALAAFIANRVTSNHLRDE